MDRVPKFERSAAVVCLQSTIGGQAGMRTPAVCDDLVQLDHLRGRIKEWRGSRPDRTARRTDCRTRPAYSPENWVRSVSSRLANSRQPTPLPMGHNIYASFCLCHLWGLLSAVCPEPGGRSTRGARIGLPGAVQAAPPLYGQRDGNELPRRH